MIINVKNMHNTQINSLKLLHNGKVRDIFELDENTMLMVTSDRISAFDVILPNMIVGKGALLNQISLFWFNKFKNIIPNHITTFPLKTVLTADELAHIDGRYMICKKLKALPVEAIVRGYLIGSGWSDYQATGQVCGIDLPDGLEQASKLPKTLFTPSTKAAVGEHDENITFDEVVKLIGKDMATQVKNAAIKLFEAASSYADERGIIIADTKFEFGTDENGVLHIMDEALTPDSSRFWEKEAYQVGTSPKSFDKQIIRDYLSTLNWDKQNPGPVLPDEVVNGTLAKYQEVIDRLQQT